MRLLLASYNYPPSIGGVQQQSHLLARGLIRRGHSVRVVSARLDGFAASEVLDGVSIERVSAGTGSRWRQMATYLGGMLAATVRLRAWADIIQVQQALYPAAAMALLSPLLRQPLVVRNTGSGQFGGVQLMRGMPLGQLSLRLIGRAATGVSLNAEMTDEMRSVGFRHVVEIPNGVELAPLNSPEDRDISRLELGVRGRVVLYVGRLDVEKGVDVLVRAWRQVNMTDATLVIVGDGPQRENLERLANAAASGHSIRFVGASSEVERYFRAADLFVLPSRSEGLSNGLLEAMANCLPVIATDVGGNRQVIRHSDLGFLVPSEDAEALALAMVGLLSRPDLRAALGLAARNHIARQYSANAMLDAYEHLYLSLERPTPLSAVP